MTSVLIGHTGFVGSNLLRQRSFDSLYHSKTIEGLREANVGEIVCAGIQAVKWWANANPREDWQGIETLLEVLRSTRAQRFVLISTVDVFKNPVGVDEGSPVEEEGLHPYGLHRRKVERFVEEHFENHLIVRLPGLYGPGLKKNVIYDLMEGRPLEGFHEDARFQFYDLEGLTADIDTAARAGLRLIHLATEPVSVASIAREAFARDFSNRPSGTPPAYDFRTMHAGRWGRRGGYLQSASEVLDNIRRFVASTAGGR